MKTYVTVTRYAGGKSVVKVSLVDGTNSAKAEATTYSNGIAQAVREARTSALEVMEQIRIGLEGTA